MVIRRADPRIGAPLKTSTTDSAAPAPSQLRTLQQALQELPSGFVILESLRDESGSIIDFRWTMVNEAALALVSREEVDMLGKRMLEVLPGNRESGLFEAYVRVVETGQQHAVAVRYDFDGIASWFELTATKLGDGFTVLFDDVTKRYNLEAQRDAATRRMEATFAGAPFPIVLLDEATLEIVSANRSAVAALGANLRAGQPAAAAFSAKCDQDRLQSALVESRQTNTPVTLTELDGPVDEHGHTRTFSVTVARIPETSLLELVAYDVSPLIEARRLAEDADKNKARVLATLTHELRNPLAAIGTAAAFLSSTSTFPRSEALSSVVDILSRQLELTTRLVDDVADASLIEHGKISLRCALVDLSELVVELTDDLRQRVPDPDALQVVCQVPDSPVPIWADRARMSQVLYNLFGNALKYTDTGHIKIVLEREADQAVLSVTDTGLGIPPDKAARIFETFYQVDDECHEQRGGLGLGLSLVAAITKLHGGTVSVRSDGLGHGTTFAVRLELHSEDA